jgi:hypothetical protein
MNYDFLIVAVGFVVVLGVACFSLRFVYGYRVRAEAMKIVLFNFIPISTTLNQLKNWHGGSWASGARHFASVTGLQALAC